MQQRRKLALALQISPDASAAGSGPLGTDLNNNKTNKQLPYILFGIFFLLIASLLLFPSSVLSSSLSSSLSSGTASMVAGLARKASFRNAEHDRQARSRDGQANGNPMSHRAPSHAKPQVGGAVGAEPWEAAGISRREWLRQNLESPDAIEADDETGKTTAQEPAGDGAETPEGDAKPDISTGMLQQEYRSEETIAQATPAELPEYARHNSFYHQSSYQCKPTGRMSFNVPAKVLEDGTQVPSSGGFDTIAAMDAGSKGHEPDKKARTGSLRFGSWSMSWPKLLKPEHKAWFTNYEIAQWRMSSGCPQQDETLVFCEQSYANGAFTLLEDSVVAGEPMSHDCGPSGRLATLQSNGAGVPPAVNVDALYWAVIPATWTFQHWMENTLPKIASALEFVPDLMLWKGVTATQELLLDRYPIIKAIYNHLGWDVIDERSRPIAAKSVIYSCVVPPLHPYLWQQGQQHVLKVAPKPLASRNKIVYCGRTRKGRVENAGREVLNEEALLTTLRQREVDGFVVEEFDNTLYPTIDDLVNYFSDVRVFIGPHGGCLTNVVFMGCNSAVIELFPLVGGRPPLGHSGMMMYMQSTFMEQHYFMLPVDTEDPQGNIHVPIDQFEQTLQNALLDSN